MNNDSLIMGILNITPDSFSDGGMFLNANNAAAHAIKLIEDGADILDIGAESTRPGATFISEEEEWNRLKPVLEYLKNQNIHIPISIDSSKFTIILKALDYGITYVNNIKGLYNKTELELLATKKLKYIAVHLHQNPQTMQLTPLDSKTALTTIKNFFDTTYKTLINAGFEPQNIYLDPGIGFGKNDYANIQLLAEVQNFSKKYNIAIGLSRKSFIGRLWNIENPINRDPISKALELSMIMMGAKIIRTHDVLNLVKLKQMLQS